MERPRSDPGGGMVSEKLRGHVFQGQRWGVAAEHSRRRIRRGRGALARWGPEPYWRGFGKGWRQGGWAAFPGVSSRSQGAVPPGRG